MNRIIAFLTVSVLMFFAACSSGPDQAMLGSISTFENSWSSLVNEAGSLGSSLKTEVAKMQDSPELQAIMAAKVDAKKKNSLDSMLTSMRDISGKAQAMAQGVDATTAKLNEVTATFTSWKEKVTKGEVKGEEAKAQLADYEKQMGDIKNQLSGIQQGWGDLNGQYGGLMAAATALTAGTAAAAAATAATPAAGTKPAAAGKQGITTSGKTTPAAGTKPAGGGTTTTTTTTTKPAGGGATTTTQPAGGGATTTAVQPSATDLQKQKTRGAVVPK